MKITTKTGDGGETGLFGGRRVSKGDGIVDLLGEIDELMAFLGWCKVGMGSGDVECGGDDGRAGKRGEEFCAILDRIQGDLFGIMSFVGNDPSERGGEWPVGVEKIDEGNVEFLERVIEDFGGGLESGFVRPGVTESESRFHIARCVCRRVERRMVGFEGKNGSEGKSDGKRKIPGIFVKYLNRLSDLLFVLARKFEGRF